AMRMVGLSSRDIRLKITGSIRHSGDTVYLVSDGDSTRFDLLNPITPDMRGYTNIYNTMARQLSPELRQKLLSGETEGLTATIEGPIFMPERNVVPVQIVVDSLQFSSPNQPTTSPAPPATTPYHPYSAPTTTPSYTRPVTPPSTIDQSDRVQRLEQRD